MKTLKLKYFEKKIDLNDDGQTVYLNFDFIPFFPLFFFSCKFIRIYLNFNKKNHTERSQLKNILN